MSCARVRDDKALTRVRARGWKSMARDGNMILGKGSGKCEAFGLWCKVGDAYLGSILIEQRP
jgi:hypothetical protein